MSTALADLATGPLLWLTLTVGVYWLAMALYRRSRAFALLNPVLVSALLMVVVLRLTKTSYQVYLEGARFLHFLLGPATVALAVPLREHMGRLRQALIPILLALLIGSLTAIVSAVGIGWLLGLSPQALLSLLPKSVTTPIAMGVSEKIGGLPSLTAVLVILTGIIGAVAARDWLDLLRVRDEAARGFAIGLSSHGIGTARALQLGQETGAFSGLAMGLNGVLTALLAPLLVRLLGWN